MIENFDEICKAKFEYMQEVYNHFLNENIKKHYDEFCLIEAFNDFSYELGRKADSYIPSPDKPYFQFALLRIHEKAVKVYREATILLQYGSASGAMARWRLLFELSVVANVLVKKPELSYKYINHCFVDDYRFGKKLVENKDKLQLEQYNLDAWSTIKSTYEKICKDFAWKGDNYEWAKCDEIKSPNLFELSKFIGQDHFYAYVDESHLYNHPSARYLMGDMGAKAPNVEDQIFLFSPFELHLPMQLIVSSLHQVNCALILGYGELENADHEELLEYLKTNSLFPETLINKVKEIDL